MLKTAYDALGQVTGQTDGLGWVTSYAHNGLAQYTEPESNRQYLRARHYDPKTAQLLTRDPITSQTREPYTYANNSPTNC